MLKFFASLEGLFRSLSQLAFVALVGCGVWVGYTKFYPMLALEHELEEQKVQLAQYELMLQEKSKEIQRLDTALRLMKVDQRVAQMVVLDQWHRAKDNELMTKLAFAEVDEKGNMLDGYDSLTIEGNIVYIDSWVAKFLDEHVESGIPLRSTSICLFRRLFGENQRPREGFALDAVGSRPAAYSRGAEMSDLEKDIWSNFWQFANDPAKAQEVGLRALQGEAPSIRLMKGKIYWVFLRASDGLTIKVADQPAPAVAEQSQPNAVQSTSYEQVQTR